jgi:hypothetical protein
VRLLTSYAQISFYSPRTKRSSTTTMMMNMRTTSMMRTKAPNLKTSTRTSSKPRMTKRRKMWKDGVLQGRTTTMRTL